MQEAKQAPPIIIEPKSKATAAVIWLHGLGADGNDFAGLVPELRLPTQHGIRFIFPNAPVQAVTINGGMEMRSWYDIRSTDFMNDIDAAGIRVSCHEIHALVQQQIDSGIDVDKIVLAGFSQGGLIALHAGLSFSQALAGIMALSTYCPMSEQFHLHLHLPILMAHGKFDTVIPMPVAKQSAESLTQCGYVIEWYEYPMEHQVCLDEIEDISTWLVKTLSIAL
ncbi:alpha/beta hydrolase [Thiomicrorhabdus arctica]|uniref:alpha/beta hydrolase n=1 Tax=Thiomicrorhabdus arctica TaxID=131540 RepID=UPI00037E0994|nr:hypothetical protein [Thiomicrorhabdus arctica]